MQQYIVDSVWNAGGQQDLGIMTISNLSYPTTVDPNTSFHILYHANNTSTTVQTAFGYIFDLGTQQQIAGSYWEQPVAAGSSFNEDIIHPGISQTLSAEVRVGHTEGEITCSSPGGAEDDYVCGSPTFLNAPTLGHRYQCVDGVWTDRGVDAVNCPVGGCTEGAQQCIDGYINNCTGGQWVPTAQTCGKIPINPMMIGALIAVVAVVGIVFLVRK